jgi:hypothetical protein
VEARELVKRAKTMGGANKQASKQASKQAACEPLGEGGRSGLPNTDDGGEGLHERAKSKV